MAEVPFSFKNKQRRSEIWIKEYRDHKLSAVIKSALLKIATREATSVALPRSCFEKKKVPWVEMIGKRLNEVTLSAIDHSD
ncbi:MULTISPECIES: hypothetical protein [unclassified Sphingobacterium]|uniref:hypothetical protein n=1 Tax=unclassified Sphingobacterium TaxID=2609468 RepID=UPI0025CBA55E|nr:MULTISPECIES: hypothetical protein [unclassified Sphingobacterium]